MEKPHTNWTFALETLARNETKSIHDFFEETDRHFHEKVDRLRAEADREGPSSDEDVDWYVNVRDELESFGQWNRYFAMVQAYSLVERIFSHIVESAIEYGILDKSILGRLKFPNATTVKKGFEKLGISLPAEDDSALQALAEKRHIILHSGGWYQSEKRRPGKLAPMIRLEFAEADVAGALDLALRCANSAISQYRTILLACADGGSQSEPPG